MVLLKGMSQAGRPLLFFHLPWLIFEGALARDNRFFYRFLPRMNGSPARTITSVSRKNCRKRSFWIAPQMM